MFGQEGEGGVGHEPDCDGGVHTRTCGKVRVEKGSMRLKMSIHVHLYFCKCTVYARTVNKTTSSLRGG